MKNVSKILVDGLNTGLCLQLAIGPVFMYVVNLALQRTIYDGFAAVLAVTLVDYFYSTLSVISIGKLLEKKNTRNISGIISSIVLIIFGVIMIRSVLSKGLTAVIHIKSVNVFSSFFSVLILTISNPLTIAFFTGLFTSKTIEHNYTKKELYLFGFSTGSATFLFMGLSVILISLLKETVPVIMIRSLNLIVGFVITGYGIIRIVKILKKQRIEKTLMKKSG
jgi:arginine exporter protein ArgO